jgi:hypothetical protein
MHHAADIAVHSYSRVPQRRHRGGLRRRTMVASLGSTTCSHPFKEVYTMLRKLIVFVIASGLAVKAVQRLARSARIDNKLERDALQRWEDEAGAPTVPHTAS